MESVAAVAGDGGCERQRNPDLLGGEGQCFGRATVKVGPCVADDAPDPARLSAGANGE